MTTPGAAPNHSTTSHASSKGVHNMPAAAIGRGQGGQGCCWTEGQFEHRDTSFVVIVVQYRHIMLCGTNTWIFLLTPGNMFQ